MEPYRFLQQFFNRNFWDTKSIWLIFRIREEYRISQKIWFCKSQERKILLFIGIFDRFFFNFNLPILRRDFRISILWKNSSASDVSHIICDFLHRENCRLIRFEIQISYQQFLIIKVEILQFMILERRGQELFPI